MKIKFGRVNHQSIHEDQVLLVESSDGEFFSYMTQKGIMGHCRRDEVSNITTLDLDEGRIKAKKVFQAAMHAGDEFKGGVVLARVIDVDDKEVFRIYTSGTTQLDELGFAEWFKLFARVRSIQQMEKDI